MPIFMKKPIKARFSNFQTFGVDEIGEKRKLSNLRMIADEKLKTQFFLNFDRDECSATELLTYE